MEFIERKVLMGGYWYSALPGKLLHFLVTFVPLIQGGANVHVSHRQSLTLHFPLPRVESRDSRRDPRESCGPEPPAGSVTSRVGLPYSASSTVCRVARVSRTGDTVLLPIASQQAGHLQGSWSVQGKISKNT